MRHRFVSVATAALMLAGLATADEKAGVAANKVPRTADGHPDLSGTWAYAIDLPPVVLKEQVNGSVSIKTIDQSWREPAKAPIPDPLPPPPAPSYPPSFQSKPHH